VIPFKLYLYGGILLALVIALALGAIHERDVQHGKDLAQAQVAVIAALKHNQELETQWTAKLRAAEDRHAKELADNAAAAAATPIPVVRVCRDAGSRPVPGPATVADDHPTGAGGIPAGDALPARAGPDIGAGLDLLARSADSVVAACRVLTTVR
jgi:hypothetical protein